MGVNTTAILRKGLTIEEIEKAISKKYTDVEVTPSSVLNFMYVMFKDGKDIAGNAYFNYMDKKGGWDSVAEDAIHSYQTLWQKINGINSWSKNPFVWVYDFKVVECPEGFL